MKKLLGIFSLILISISAAHADKTIYVSPTGTGTGASAANPCKLNQIFGTLTPNVALDATGTTTIIFDVSSAYSMTTTGTSDATKGCVVVPDNAKKIIFEGNNATLNAATTAIRMFRIGASTNIELKNLTFRNGVASSSTVGGAIFFAGDSLKISGCVFDNNSAGSGGAVSSRGKYLKITNSYFLNNKLTTSGRGAAITHTGISSGGTLVIENVTFNNNTGFAGNPTYGAAICTAFDGSTRNYLNSITISNCTFYKNLTGVTSNFGYATVYLDSISTSNPTSTVRFLNNTFYGNSNCGIYIKGGKYSVGLVNNVIVGDSWGTISDPGKFDHGIIANTTIAKGRPAITAYNNYIVTKAPLSSAITELSSGTNGNTFVSTSSQTTIDNVYLSLTLQSSAIPYLPITSILSPLVNAGTNSVSGISIPTTDVTGFQRTGNYTIGAYQATMNVASGASEIVNQDVSLLDVTVQPTGKLTLTPGKTLTTGTLALQSDASGTGTFVENGGTLVATTNTVQQYLTSGRNWYISSPISNATTANLSSANSVVYYNEPTSQWLSPVDGSQLAAGKGYISSATASAGPVLFSGTLNSGTVTVPLTRTAGINKEGFNLVGNPYPSYLDWSMVDTTAAHVYSTIWYRTQTAGNAYIFDTYNGSGNVSTNLGVTKVTNLIPPMQAFWVRVKPGNETGTLTFTNAMRKHADFSTNKFKAPSAKKVQQQQLLRLEVSNGVNKDEAVIYFNDNALDGFDSYDSPKMSNGNVAQPEIYTTAGTEKLVINGLKNLAGDIEIPLGFITGQTNTFSIKASEITNLNDVDVILKDKLQNKEINLLSGDAYNFSADATTTESRFAVLLKIRSVTTALKPEAESVKVHVKALDGRISILNEDKYETNIPVIIYNSTGQQVAAFSLDQPETVLNRSFAAGMYVVSIQLKDGLTTQKIIVN